MLSVSSPRLEDLLRVLRNGTRIKEEVDEAIDKVCILASPIEPFLIIHFIHSAVKSHIFESQSRMLVYPPRRALMSMRSTNMRRKVSMSSFSGVYLVLPVSRDAIFAEILFVDYLPSIPEVNATRHHAYIRDLRQLCEEPTRYDKCSEGER